MPSAIFRRTSLVPTVRLLVQPTPVNGLRSLSRVMIDKTNTVSRSKLGRFVGMLSDEEMLRVGEARSAFLAIARNN